MFLFFLISKIKKIIRKILTTNPNQWGAVTQMSTPNQNNSESPEPQQETLSNKGKSAVGYCKNTPEFE